MANTVPAPATALDPDLIRRAGAIATSTFANALDDFGLGKKVLPTLKAVAPGMRFAGPAVTVREKVGPMGAYSWREFKVGAIIEAAGPGDVVVVAMDGANVSTWGGMASMAAKTKGVAGLLVDGGVRDLEEMVEFGFPVFARHMTPTTGRGRLRVEAIGEPVRVDGVVVKPGDLIVADGTGVVVLPHRKAEKIVARAEEFAADDAAALAELLVDDPRFRRRVDAFFTAWLALDDLNTLAKADPLPPVTDALRAGLRAELLALAGHAVFQAGTLAALFESRATQLTPEVAALYGVAPDAAALPAAERAGLVTRAGLLALLAGPQFKSPIDRGAFIQRRLLCLDLPDPPPTVDNTPVAPDAQAAQTVRARTAQRTAGGACEGCHRLINPVGFTLEHYDGLGRFTATEAVGDQHLPIDATGAVPLSDIAGPVDGGLALSQALARSAQVRQCVARQWLGFFLDRPLTAADACSLAQLQAAFEASGGAWRTLFVETARLPAVRHRGGATP
ncbi:MAG: DUF1588 domain-containing protein [Myxococcales bacterium]|nr:DUF1588 domain-containing protein [Myxococcales bacterium]